MNISDSMLLVYVVTLFLIKDLIAAPTYCWDPTQTILRTDNAMLTPGAPGQITCPQGTVSCVVTFFRFEKNFCPFKKLFLAKRL